MGRMTWKKEVLVSASKGANLLGDEGSDALKALPRSTFWCRSCVVPQPPSPSASGGVFMCRPQPVLGLKQTPVPIQ